MRPAHANPSVDALQREVRQWFVQRIARYLERLADNFQRRAQTADAPQSAALLLQHSNIVAGREAASQAFADYIDQRLLQSQPYQRGAHPQLDRLAKQLGNHSGLCRATSPMSVFAGFQALSAALGLQANHDKQALALFNMLVLNELEKLYNLLSEKMRLADSGDQRENWIDHIQTQLNQQNLSAQQRALAERRLSQLRQQTPATVSDHGLLDAVNEVFRDIPQRQALPSAVAASLNSLQTQLSAIALQERGLFFNTLHPARQLCRQLVASLQRWPQAGTEARQEFEISLKQITRGILQQGADTRAFSRHQGLVDQCCQRFNRRVALSGRREQQAEDGQQSVNRLRSQIHAVLDQKIQQDTLPKSITDLLYGPWATVMLYHWLRHGSESDAARRCLNFVDEVLWYIKPHTQWTDLRRAKIMASNIEEQLLQGMKRVNIDRQSARLLINDLHQQRLNALTTGRSLRQQQP